MFGLAQTESDHDFQLAIEGDAAITSRLRKGSEGWVQISQRYERVNGKWTMVAETAIIVDDTDEYGATPRRYDA